MTMLAAVVLLGAVLGAAMLLVVLVRTVRGDGLGHRPPPPTRPRGSGERPW